MTAGEADLPAKRARLLIELRCAEINDARVLGAIGQTPRELFVPPELRDDAYENVALPIGRGQTISQPYVVALMTEKLEVEGRHKMLEIGTGSGYQAAILAQLARRVFTIERLSPLIAEAEARFASLGLHNIVCREGDGAGGWREQAPFDRIIVTAAAATIPAALVEQLAPNGILIIPVGPQNGEQKLLRLRRTEAGVSTEDLGSVRFVPLIETQANTADFTDARV